MNKGLLVVLSGPSGSGKDTVLKSVLAKLDGSAFLSVSMTTRKMREGEKEGVDYFFGSISSFFAISLLFCMLCFFCKYICTTIHFNAVA